MFFFLVCITAPPLNGVCADESSSKGMDHLAKSPRSHGQENGKSGRYPLERICSHDVLQDGGESNSPNGSNNKLKRKVNNCCDPAIAYYLLNMQVIKT